MSREGKRSPTAKLHCIRPWRTPRKVCKFDFGVACGELHRDFIYVRHLRPMHIIGEEYVLNPEEDLRPVCPNCNSMLHRDDPLLSIDKLRDRLKFNFAASVFSRNSLMYRWNALVRALSEAAFGELGALQTDNCSR